MSKNLNLQLEKAIRLLVEYTPLSNETSRKPMIPHDIRVGVYLYENNYSEDVVVAGILHDVLEFTNVNEEIILEKFGNHVLNLIKANSKNKNIEDKQERTNDNIKRCVECGEDALIIKTADILDSFKFYTATKNDSELEYCTRNAKAILKFKPNNFNDKIFEELKKWI